MKKGIKLLILLPMLLTGCNKKHEDSFVHFCDYYNDNYISAYIENVAEHNVHELRYISKAIVAKSPFKIDDYNLLYAKIDVVYLASGKFYELNWLVEYKYNDDFLIKM